MSTIPATPCVPPCVAMYPQVREMGRGASGRLCRSPASPDRAFPPVCRYSSAEGSPAEKRTGHPAAKPLGTATVPSQRSLPASARFADEHPFQSGAPGAPLSLTPWGLTAFLRSRPCRGRRGNSPKRPASSLGHPACTAPGLTKGPGCAATHPAGRIGRSFPAPSARQGLWEQDARTLPLDV